MTGRGEGMKQYTRKRTKHDIEAENEWLTDERLDQWNALRERAGEDPLLRESAAYILAAEDEYVRHQMKARLG